MAKYPQQDNQSLLMTELTEHYRMWEDDNEKRMTRKHGWNDITDAYWGKLPDDWPYATKIVDPRIRTVLIEKNARLINKRLRGKLVPRDGEGDILGARLNNALLEHQWDNANEGGSMDQKISIADQDARLYASKFALIPWMTKKDSDGNLTFDGNEMLILDIRDCGIDPASTGIRDANWFQVRRWMTIQELEQDNEGGTKYKNIDRLKMSSSNSLKTSDKKDTQYLSRIKQLKSLEDRTGEDKVFPVIEVVTEYREDRFITFAPNHGLILKDVKNPYDHKKIPIAQLRYYPLQDDPHGESEVEPVIGLWLAIQATVCGFLDEVNLKMNPPLKVRDDGSVRIETIEWGASAQWMMNDMDAVQEMNVNSDSIQFFQSAYSSLVSAFNTAMGELSQGVSSVDPFNPEKTATEVRAASAQRNTRDQKNQLALQQFLGDIMSMWVSNNKQFLFRNPKKKEHILRIVGSDAFNYFMRAGMNEDIFDNETMGMIKDIVVSRDGDVSDQDLVALTEAAKIPQFPVILNSDNPENAIVKPKMQLNEMEDSAELSLVPEDLEGNYDYIADVRSAAAGADVQLAKARTSMIGLITENQGVIQLLEKEGYDPKIKELLVASLEEGGLKDAERYFEKRETTNPDGAGATNSGGIQQGLPEPGRPELSLAAPQISPGQQMAQPIGSGQGNLLPQLPQQLLQSPGIPGINR